MSKTFTEAVKAVVAKIPSGQTMTYGAVAKAAGRERAYRAVANVMAANYDLAVPCHRVVRGCLLYTSPSPRDRTRSRMPSSA